MAKSAAKSEPSATVVSRTSAKQERMVRKQILLTPDQNRKIKALAVATSRTEADLFREAVDAQLTRVAADNQDWKTAWLAAAGMWADYPEIDEKIVDARARRRLRRERLFGNKE